MKANLRLRGQSRTVLHHAQPQVGSLWISTFTPVIPSFRKGHELNPGKNLASSFLSPTTFRAKIGTWLPSHLWKFHYQFSKGSLHCLHSSCKILFLQFLLFDQVPWLCRDEVGWFILSLNNCSECLLYVPRIRGEQEECAAVAQGGYIVKKRQKLAIRLKWSQL